MDTFAIQTKINDKWTDHATIGGTKADALKTWGYVKGTLTTAARLVEYDYKGRVHVVATLKQRAGYRVTYGETMPVWSRVLPTLSEAQAFANKHRSFGDIVFSVEAVA